MKEFLEAIAAAALNNRQQAEDYLRLQRKIPPEKVKDYDFGLMTRFDISAALSKAQIKLDSHSNEKRLLDTAWETRIVFPVYSPTGQIIRLESREISEKKYGAFFDKDNTYMPAFYGMENNIEKIWQKGVVVLTEGVIDLLAVASVFPQLPVLASMTQSLNKPQINFLNRYADRVVLLYDRGTSKIYQDVLVRLDDVPLVEALSWSSTSGIKLPAKTKDVAAILASKGSYILKKILSDQFEFFND